MNFEILLNDNLIGGFKNLVSKIDQTKFEHNAIIVPDKFSLNAEKILFDVLKINSTLNIEVLSFSKLANIVLEDILKDKQLINKQISTLIISDVVEENKDKLNFFKNLKNLNGFYEDVFNVISLLQSSNISVDDLNEIDALKVKDFQLIYKLYNEKLKNVNVDASKKFELLNSEIQNSTYIKNTNFYFGMFYNLTAQMQKIVGNLVKFSKSITFACVSGEDKKNRNIFDDSIYKSLLKISKNLKIEPKISVLHENFNENLKFLYENMFSNSKSTLNLTNDNLKLVECQNPEIEVENCLNEIKYDIISKKLRFSDICIVLTNFEEYNFVLKRYLEKFDFPFFMDEDIKLIDTSFAKFILNVFNVVKSKFEVNSVLSLLKNEFIKIDEKKKLDFENFVFKYNLTSKQITTKINNFKDDEFYLGYLEVFDNFIEKLKNLNSELLVAKNPHEVFLVLNNYFNEIYVDDTLNKKNDYYKQTDLLKLKQNLQVKNKILEVFDNIENFMQVNFNLNKLFYFVELLFNNTSILTPPVSVDSIFVGEIYNSYFTNFKNIYFLGCSNKFMPKVSPDMSLLSDDDIERTNLEISPKISDVNRLNYFKCFINLFCATQKLYLSYSTSTKNSSKAYKSNFILEIQKLVKINEKNLELIKPDLQDLDFLNNDDFLNILALNSKSEKDLIKQFFVLENAEQKNLLLNLFDHLNINLKVDEKNLEKITAPINISVSKLEDYFTCKRKFFYKHILKIKEKESLTLNAKYVGNIVHSVSKKFADILIKNEVTEKNINTIITNIFDDVLSEKEYKFLFLHKKNGILIEFLKIETIKFLNNLFVEQQNSNFKVTKTEFKFNGEINNFKFLGIADRVDIFEDKFVVIDYKTGSTKFNFSDIFLGKKIQLTTYAYFLEKVLNKKCVGIYYLNINDDFLSENLAKKLKFDGLTVFSDNTLYDLDNNITYEKDEIKSEFFDFSSKFLITESEFEKLENYCVNLIENALKDFENSSFEPNPLMQDDEHNACTYCEYKTICCNAKFRRVDENLNKKKLIEEIKDE